ncbi:MAG TPA: mechanosensitive ion channel family protein [Mycobacteriales bacterium]|nr:mechanosensitive ion channel family protein [Mycobacteriales bacterium]
MHDLITWLRGSGLLIAIYITGAEVLARLVRWIGARLATRIDREQQRSNAVVRSEAAKHRHAVAQVGSWIGVVLIYVLAFVAVVRQLGLPLAGIVAPATVVGVALGFGAQRIVQDTLAGFFILTERQYGYGDVIRISTLGSIEGVTGTVEAVTLRITRMRTANGEVVMVPNGQLVQVANLSRDWARAVIDVPVPAGSDVAKVTAGLQEVAAAAYQDEHLRTLIMEEPVVSGVETLDLDKLHLRLTVRTLPGKQFEVTRELRRRIAIELHSDARVSTEPTAGAQPVGGR